MTLFILLLIGLVLGWGLGSPVAWLIHEKGKNFNWRIWLGPVVYYNWRERNHTL